MDGASGSASEEEAHEEQERRAFEKVVQAMLNYEADVLPEIERWERNFKRLPSKQQHLLHSERVKFVAARQCVHANARSLHAILGAFDSSAAPAHLRVDLGESETCGQPNDPQDAEKVCSYSRALFRYVLTCTSTFAATFSRHVFWIISYTMLHFLRICDSAGAVPAEEPCAGLVH